MDILEYVKKKYGEVDAVINVYSMQVIWASEKLHKTLGYSSGELIKMPIRKLLPIDSSALTSLMSLALEKKVEGTREVMTKSGEKISKKTTLRAFSYNEEPHVTANLREEVQAQK